MTRYPFSVRSGSKLAECRVQLQEVFHEVSDVIDCTVLCGKRSKEEQDEAFRAGLSKLTWPRSKHNVVSPSYRGSSAIDVAPYPIDWRDTKRFYFLAGVVKAVARSQSVEIIWGGDWDSDNDFSDQTFMDLVHFELE